MDTTPDRNHKQSCTPSTKVEDSPVFNFINNLSPLKPVKSACITRIFTSSNFSSPPSIFTSPHVSSNREPRVLKRHQSLDPSKSKLVLRNENSACCNEEVSAQLYDNSAEVQGNFDPGDFIVEANTETPGKQFKNVSELPITMKYLHGSPDVNATPCRDTAMELAGTSKALVPVVCETSEKVLEDNLHLLEMHHTEQKVEGLHADWDSSMSNVADLIMFSSPPTAETIKGLMQKRLESEANIGTSNMSKYLQVDLNYVQKEQLVVPGGTGEHEIERHCVQPRESIELAAAESTYENPAIPNLDSQTASCVGEKAENEPVSYLHCGILRRCLDFEMVGGHENVESNGSSSAKLSQSDAKFNPLDKQLIGLKPGTDTSRCALPGIGLHLNAIGTTSKEYKYMKHEASYSEKQQQNTQTDQNSLNKSSASTSSEGDIQVTEIRHQLAEQASETFTKEECNPTSPKKKRRKVEAAGEPEACKRCNCKKSKCLKLYCECFAAGIYCIESCSCQDCFNKPIHEDTVLATRRQIESRNPLAFAPKVILPSDLTSDTGDEYSNTPASARHKRGCNCKKSSCLKKYCECYQGGVGCSMNCRCESCKNVFGRKEESETCEKTAMGTSLQKTEFQESEEQLPASATAKTPLQLGRPLGQPRFSSKGRPQRSSPFIVGSSSGLYASHKLGKPDFIQPQQKFENQLQSVPEDYMPEVLHVNCSPGSGVKTASPNSKRVSPPSCGSGSSPARRSGRKLILQSIPSFPSFTPQH